MPKAARKLQAVRTYEPARRSRFWRWLGRWTERTIALAGILVSVSLAVIVALFLWDISSGEGWLQRQIASLDSTSKLPESQDRRAPRIRMNIPLPARRGASSASSADVPEGVFSFDALAGAGRMTRSLQQVRRRVTEFYARHGVKDREFIQMQVLAEYDLSYHEALAEAFRLHGEGMASEAVRHLRGALEDMDSQNLIGRLRLLELLATLAWEARDPAAGKAAEAELIKTREKALEILLKGLEGVADVRPELAPRLRQELERWKRDSARRDEIVRALAGTGEDLEGLPEKLLKMVLEGPGPGSGG